jgi:hypothetical protein
MTPSEIEPTTFRLVHEKRRIKEKIRAKEQRKKEQRILQQRKNSITASLIENYIEIIYNYLRGKLSFS